MKTAIRKGVRQGFLHVPPAFFSIVSMNHDSAIACCS